jgi:hypothetical protein
VRQHLRKAIAQHLALTETEVERVRDVQREAVLRIVDYEIAVARERAARITVEERESGRGVTALAIVRVRFLPGDRAKPRNELAGGRVRGAHKDRGAQAMRQRKASVALERKLDSSDDVTAARVKAFERALEQVECAGILRRNGKTASVDVRHGGFPETESS